MDYSVRRGGGPVTQKRGVGVSLHAIAPSMTVLPPLRLNASLTSTASFTHTHWLTLTGSLTLIYTLHHHWFNDLRLADAPDVAHQLQVLCQFHLQLLGGQ